VYLRLRRDKLKELGDRLHGRIPENAIVARPEPETRRLEPDARRPELDARRPELEERDRRVDLDMRGPPPEARQQEVRRPEGLYRVSNGYLRENVIRFFCVKQADM
jgi:hypothetical protein